MALMKMNIDTVARTGGKNENNGEENVSAAAAFEQRLAWTIRQMTMTKAALDRWFPPPSSSPSSSSSSTNVRLAMSIHLDIKVLPLLIGLLDRGIPLFLTTCNPTTVRDDVVRYAIHRGAEAYAWKDMSQDDYNDAIEKALAWKPTHLCEMGAAITTALHTSKNDQMGKNSTPPPPPHNIRASLEATGSGINKLLLQGGEEDHHQQTTTFTAALSYPIYNWDDVPVKEGLHNRHMVGITTWHAFFHATHLTLHEKMVLIIGYGLVGQGLCDAARAYGGTILVCETDKARAHQARYAGWQVVESLEQGIAMADVICTATGAEKIIGLANFDHLRDGVFLLNAGHTANEIDVVALRQRYPIRRQVLPHVEEITIPIFNKSIDNNGSNRNNDDQTISKTSNCNKTRKSIFLVCGGSMANLTVGDGDSINSFDLTLAVMTAGIGFILDLDNKRNATTTDHDQRPPGLHLLPEFVWRSAI